jgi:hypothetical protein
MKVLLHVKNSRDIEGGIARKVSCRAKDKYETLDKENKAKIYETKVSDDDFAK